MSRALSAWIEREYPIALAGMMQSISPVGIVKQRAGFAQTIVPKRGAIVASPVLGAYDPDPDYFYHWFRDAAVIMDALRLAFFDGGAGTEALGHLSAFVQFSLSLRQLDGRALVESASWRDHIAVDFRQYLRDDAELARVYGPALPGETRVNADGTLDISRWGRPQHDGPALRALTLMRWTRDAILPVELAASLEILLRADLAYVHRFAPEPCFDIWEEDIGLHYYTLRVSAAALLHGAQWLESQPAGTSRDVELARACREKARALITLLNDFWLPEQGYYRSRRLPGGVRSVKELDISVTLAAVHAGEREGPHTPLDEHQQSTLERLCALFSASYPINRASPGIGPAMGRYADDRYYSGGAWYLATLGAAEFCYLAGDRARGDAFLETVRRFTPASGELSEQFDQRSGVQTSAKQLAWSYAAFISCRAARRESVGA
ncbi:MAG TPA: glycoside hydrolase family 15 protein [Steroidobacteraceae bacterium]|nr:glycoside hydrolase family 15 protein [Steroidobacteraceae bacterium]